jgi:hypothetical protein
MFPAEQQVLRKRPRRLILRVRSSPAGFAAVVYSGCVLHVLSRGGTVQKSHIWRQFEALSPSAQRQVADFISFLAARARRVQSAEAPSSGPFTEEPFVGLWRDRQDMSDSAAWVRRVREEEWAHERG